MGKDVENKKNLSPEKGADDSGCLSLRNAREVAVAKGKSLTEVEGLVVNDGIIPLRYQRNIGSIMLSEQRILMDAWVAIIGCGGLGGTVLEELARLGVGNIKVWDHDVLEEHNLNRQLLSTIDAIGQSKAGAARARVASINPAVNLHAEASRFDGERDRAMICDCQVVVDCLDNISDRLALSALCREFKIPLVHGAVEGWMGQITTQFPEDRVIEAIYEQSQNATGKTTISTPAFTPAVVASLQAAEVVKILLGRGELLRGRIMLINLLDMDFDSIDIK